MGRDHTFLFFKEIFIYLFLCICVHCSCTDGCEPSCGCWELYLGPLLTPVDPACSIQSCSLSPCSLRTKDLFYYYKWVHYCCLQTHQKRVSDLIISGCEPPCGCWDLNSEPSEEQSVFLPAEPSCQPSSSLPLSFPPPSFLPSFFIFWVFVCFYMEILVSVAPGCICRKGVYWLALCGLDAS